MNCCIVASGESVDILSGVGVELVSEPDGKFIGRVNGVAVVFEVVDVVVSSILER